ncbi:uncharacterized protein LOC141804006 [Halichoeres trimaculatus]|uniref:uncharacterized protein LOC141804006 n=1 Tax=Halichoeres trimaculatus TaxID=147232 RepID=UPI003D9E0CBC
MAFTNLFTRLPVFGENIKSPVQPAFTDRKETENGSRPGDGGRKNRKRKNNGKHTGSYEKKPRVQTQTTRTNRATSFRDDKHQAKHSQSSFCEYADAGFSNKVLHRHIHKTDCDNVSRKGHCTKTKNEQNVNQKREQKKKWEPQRHQQRDGRRRAYGGGGGRPRRTGGEDRKNRNEDSKEKRTRFMTQEFKDQNAISVGDRLLCRHFLWGKCIKGDECQLEHVEGHNDLVKESCKFYIQGACIKGESCPYMHKSFPCKFFHRKGKCNQGESCRFSHEPLNELTNKLLDEALQRENELIELSKKAAQESSEQPVNSEQSENTEATKTSDVVFQPLRPNFYQSVEIKAEEKAPSPQIEEVTENSEEAVTPHAAQPHSAPSENLNQKEPVCYSVEAVLGPQLSKPLLSFSIAPKGQDPAPLRSSDSPPASTSNKNHAPYSVEAVLKSFKSVETPPPPTSQTVSCSHKAGSKGISHSSSETQNEKSFYSAEGNRFQKLFQSLPSLQTPSNLTSNSCSDLTLPSGGLRRQVGNMQESPKPEVRSEQSDTQESDIGESRNLHMDIKHSVDSNGEGVDHFGAHKHKTVSSNSSSQTSSPSAPKPHLSVMAPAFRAPIKPFTPSSDSSKFKGKNTVPTAPISIPMKSSDPADFASFPTLKQPKDTATDCSSKKADGHLAGGCKLKTSFHSLFAKPLTDSLQRKDALQTSLCPQGSKQSSCPAPEGFRANSLKTAVQPDKPPARSFVSLFAAPLSSLQPQGDHSRTLSASQKPIRRVEAAPRFSDSEQRAGNLQTQRPEKADVQTPLGVKGVCPVPTSALFSPDSECTDEITDRSCSPVSASPCEGSAPRVITETTTHTDLSLSKITSCKEVAGKSILRTLFQRLGPYKQDVEQQDPDQEIQKEADISTRRVFENQEPTSRKRRQKK